MVINLEPSVVLALYIKAFLIGAAAGAVWDIARFIKMLCGVRYGEVADVPPISRIRRVLLYILSFLIDVVFWVLLGVSSILLFYNVSGGVFRASTYLFLFFGLVLYYFSFGRLTLALSARLIVLLKRIFAFAIRIIGVPLAAVRRAIIFIYHLTIGKIIGRIIEKMKEKRTRRAIAADAPNDEGEERVKDEEIGLYRKDGRIRF